MAESNYQSKTVSLKDAAQNAIKSSGINPDEALALRLRDAKKQAEAGSEQHQERMRALARKMSELQPKQVLKPSSRSEQSSSGKESADTEKEAARAPAASPSVATFKVMPASENKKRKVAVTTRSPDKRLDKKVKARIEQMKQVVQKTPSVKETVRQPQKAASPTAKKGSNSREEDAMPSKTVVVSARNTKNTPLVKDTIRKPQKTVSLTVKDSNPKDQDVTSSEITFTSAGDTERYTILSKLPEWYTSISMDGIAMKKLSRKRPPALAALDSLKALVQQCEFASSKKSGNLSDLFDKLRDAVHNAEITLTITPEILRKANMLHPQSGLPRIFQPSANFPPDLKADSYQLYKRWATGDLKQSLLRGIISEKSHSRNSDRLDPNDRAQFYHSFKYIGHGNLVQGQWWPTQLCAMRDGAHGAPQGGICGSSEQGAYSIVLSSGVGYDDTDDGDTIYYSGTSGSDGEATENTKHLLVSLETGHPVRVLRSAQLPKGNPYRPERGLRYDGLYTVVDVKLLDEEKAMHRFRLERCKGQMGIRYQGKGARPTAYEVEEYEKLKDEGAWKAAGGS